jgi:soluble lytic murein transglycosylase-like protein
MLGAVVLSPETLEPIINEMGSKYGIDPSLIKAHIKAESNWDVNASRYEVHKTDASWGLMQLMLETARGVLGQPDLTTTQLINPRTNIEAGTAYIAQNMKRYKGIVPDAIAAYNAGSARFKAPPKEYEYINQDYVDKVWKNYGIYKTLGTGMMAEAATSISEAATDVLAGNDLTPVYIFAGLIAAVVLFSSGKSSEA